MNYKIKTTLFSFQHFMVARTACIAQHYGYFFLFCQKIIKICIIKVNKITFVLTCIRLVELYSF